MKRIYYAERDTTLYERYPERNTGIDPMIELSKVPSGSLLNGVRQANTYTSRILLDFGSQLQDLLKSIVDGESPEPNSGVIRSGSAYIELRASEASDLLHSYTLHANSISESWDNGNGRFDDSLESKIGASWYYRSGDARYETGIPWNTGSAQSKDTSPGSTETTGGGSWVTGSGGLSNIIAQASQSFYHESPDVRIDVTDLIVRINSSSQFSGDYIHEGFIIRRPNVDETSQENFGSIKFFGTDTHTIYAPRLCYEFDDVVLSDTSSQISSNTYVPYIKNIKSEYRTSEIAQFRIGVRPEFPVKTYTTSSFYITTDKLPLSSSYSILDSVTNEIILKDENNYSNSTTKISFDDAGSFFNLRMDSFLPERYYKIQLKCRRPNDTQMFDDFYFKVVN